jgi:hypothetical protein
MWREPHIDTAAGAAQRATSAPPAADSVYCPECGMPAWVEWADLAPTTSGPAEHVKIRCFSRHWFLMLRESLG